MSLKVLSRLCMEFQAKWGGKLYIVQEMEVSFRLCLTGCNTKGRRDYSTILGTTRLRCFYSRVFAEANKNGGKVLISYPRRLWSYAFIFDISSSTLTWIGSTCKDSVYGSNWSVWNNVLILNLFNWMTHKPLLFCIYLNFINFLKPHKFSQIISIR